TPHYSTLSLHDALPISLPWYFQNYALLEELARRARSAGGAGYTTTMLSLGNTEPWTVSLDPVGRDSMTILLGSIGRLRARVDERSEEHTSELQSLAYLV